MRRSRKIILVGVLGASALVGAPASTVTVARAQAGPAQRTAHNDLRVERVKISPGVSKAVPALSGSTAQTALDTQAARDDARTQAGDTGAPTGPVSGDNGQVSPNQLGIAPRTLGCSKRLGNGSGDNGDGQGNNTDSQGKAANVRVNQDCTFRRQAEEINKFNPTNPNNLIAGQNDSRLGYNQCGFDYSFDGGKLWGDGNPPFRQKQNNPAREEPIGPNDPAGRPEDNNRHTIAGGPGTLHTYDAFSDPALAFDSQGRAFFSCIGFDIASSASGLFVTASPVGAGGSFYNNVSAFSRKYVVAEDNNSTVFHDKQFIVADAFVGSPNRDNVYVTWTVFKFGKDCAPTPGGTPDGAENQCQSPIFGSMSTDHARSWSTPEQISGTSDTLCFGGNLLQPSANPHSCNFDQGSDPIALPNGDLQVIFNNGNTRSGDPNGQQLGVHCKPTGSSPNGSAHLNCAQPSKVGDDISAGEPLCDFGRGPEECIPGAYIRTNDFPRIAINRDNGHLYATWQDYRVRSGAPTGTGPREFDIRLSQSLDGGLTWKEAAAPVNPDAGRDHYFPAIDVSASPQGTASRSQKSSGQGEDVNAQDHVGVSYFRTDRVPNEDTNPTDPKTGAITGFTPGQPGVQKGNSDYALAGGRGLRTPYAAEVVSPEFPPPDGAQAGFNGDYSGLIVIDNVAHPIWSDTRNAVPYSGTQDDQGVKRDEDIFTVTRGLPDGRGDNNNSQGG